MKNIWKLGDHNRHLAFTLVEMLIVVVIIWILAAALIPRLIWAQSQARDVARKKWMSDISAWLEVFYNDKGKYPSHNTFSSVPWIWFLWCTSQLGIILSWIVSDIPNDPQKNKVHYWTEMEYDSNWVPVPDWTPWFITSRYCLTWSYIYKDLSNIDWATIVAQWLNPYDSTLNWWGTSYVLAANMENMKNNNFMFFWSSVNPLNWATQIEDGFWRRNSKKYYQDKFFCWEKNIKIDPTEAKCQWPDVKKANYSIFSIN